MGSLHARIETARLLLVPLSAEAARALEGGDLSVVAHAEDWPHADTLDAVRRTAGDAERWPVWLVTLDGVVIGDCGWDGPIDAAGDIAIGYGLAAGHRGQGYGTELVSGLSAWLLGQPGVRRVVANVEPANVPSRRALERAGFTLDRSDGELVSYALAG